MAFGYRTDLRQLVFFGITVDQSLKSAPDAWKPLMIFGIFAVVFAVFVRQVVVVFDRPAGTVVILTRTGVWQHGGHTQPEGTDHSQD